MQDPQSRNQESGIRSQESASGLRSPRITDSCPMTPDPSRLRRAFTLTELLIVIAIIAVLAALITAAAVNALRAANRGRIIMTIQGISRAAEDFKVDYGAYPPNGMNPNPGVTTPGSPAQLVKSDFTRMAKKAFPRINSAELDVFVALAGEVPPSGTSIVKSGPVDDGMSAAEAVYFWFGGFSSDEQFPLSGPGGPSHVQGEEILENRAIRYEFELTQLQPRNDAGGFDESENRFVQYEIDLNSDGNIQANELRQINLWRYHPKGSEVPIAYFDASRHKPGVAPGSYDPPFAQNASVYALKQLREGAADVNVGGAAGATEFKNVVFVNQGKCQIIHAGLDDAWGDESFEQMSCQEAGDADSLLLYPTGPFIGEIADTLSNFSEGTLEDATEE